MNSRRNFFKKLFISTTSLSLIKDQVNPSLTKVDGKEIGIALEDIKKDEVGEVLLSPVHFNGYACSSFILQGQSSRFVPLNSNNYREI